MVFTEQTGLENLYSMVNYCVDQSTCKRKLIAQHFNENSWSKDGKCNRMCDCCKNADTCGEQVNLIEEARAIVQVLEKQSLKDKSKRITANKLAELSFEEIKKISTTHKLSLYDVERLIINMIMKNYLKEDFHFTPYATICYVIKDALSSELDNHQYFYMRLSDLTEEKTSDASPKSSSKSSKSKKAIADGCVVLSDDDDGYAKSAKRVRK